MNCTNCNTPGAPHELIGGLCHACTATERDSLRAQLELWIKSRADLSEELRQYKLKLEAANKLLEPLRIKEQGDPRFLELLERAKKTPTYWQEMAELADSEYQHAKKQLEAAQAAGAEMRICIEQLVAAAPHEGEGAQRAIACLKARELLESSDCGKAYRERMERYEKALRVIADRLEIVAHIGTENDFEELKEIADQALRETTP